MGFRGVRPPGQPRTLRSNAEDKGTVPANFVDGGVEASGLPNGVRGAGETYVDVADSSVHAAPTPSLSPSPFASIRKGR
jgi:hypothetical protein